MKSKNMLATYFYVEALAYLTLVLVPPVWSWRSVPAGVGCILSVIGAIRVR